MASVRSADKLRKSLAWIVNVLVTKEVPFAVCGGLAAKIYGSPRKVNDIDIDIPAQYFDAILHQIRPYVKFGPARYIDERWDLLLATLNYRGQEIDIAGGNTTYICDVRTGEWFHMPTNFDEIEHQEVFGMNIPVVSRRELIAYKSMLAGAHQQIDIIAVKENASRSGHMEAFDKF